MTGSNTDNRGDRMSELDPKCPRGHVYVDENGTQRQAIVLSTDGSKLYPIIAAARDAANRWMLITLTADGRAVVNGSVRLFNRAPFPAWEASVENIVVSRNGENRVHVRTTVTAMTDGTNRVTAEVVK